MEKTLLTTTITSDTQLAQLEKKKYDLVFIGGGPSTIAFISYLFQKKHSEKVFTSTNILIIEKSENFGSGCLGKYGINTNTSSEGFPRLIYYTEGGQKEKTGKLALSPTKNPMKASKNYKNGKELVANKNQIHNIKKNNSKPEKVLDAETKDKIIFKRISIFAELYESSAVQTLITIGNRPAPLSLVGYFLDCLGNFITSHVCKNYGKNILLNNTEVKSVKIYNNEEYGIIVKKGPKSSIIIKTRCLVLSTGGKQSIENPYYKSILSTLGEEKVFISDYLLMEEGYKKLINQLNNSNINTRKKKIVIIGGSHSGFSSAWILLNDPASYISIKKGDDYETKREYACVKCSGECICFGKVFDRNWCLYENNREELEIYILYRDHIKVYYPTQEEAHEDNYTNYDPKEALNKQGRLYPFVGIRGDAKDLYNKIIRGEEKRVQLIHTQTNQEQQKFIKEADAVIWACGYITNNLPIFDARNNPIDFLTDEVGTLEVNKELQLIGKNKIPFKNLYGIGQGYSTKTPEIINGKKARADSIHIYNTYIASKLYKSLEYFFNKNSIENINKNFTHQANTYASNNLKRKSEILVSDNNEKKGKSSLLFKASRQILNFTGNNIINTNHYTNNIYKENYLKRDRDRYREREYDSNIGSILNNEIKTFSALPLPNFNKNFTHNIEVISRTKNSIINNKDGSPKNKNIFFQTDSINEMNAKRMSYKERMDYENIIRSNFLKNLNNANNV